MPTSACGEGVEFVRHPFVDELSCLVIDIEVGSSVLFYPMDEAYPKIDEG